MTFEDILDQAIAMLQRRGRVTYRTLKRQFQLDDDVLEDLKEALIDGQRLAVDEDGRVLVWTGGASTPEASASPPPHQEISHAAPTPSASPPPEPYTPDAERRQLTVLFCDLVDSTVLASQLDPEDLREVVRAYQAACAKVIARFEGHIAQYLGDGLLVYFGYPLAHEDDAQRAVRAGLGMVDALGQLNTRLAQERGVHLAVRLGIHTGLVVVGEVGSGTRQEQLQVGETPELGPVLFGLYRFYLVRSQLHTARELGESLLRLAQRVHDPALAVIAHTALGVAWWWLGALPAARLHLEEGSARYTPDQRTALVFRIGQDPGVACRTYAAMTPWLLGYPAQALARLHEALALAQELAHPYSLAYARCWAAMVSQLRRDVPAVHKQAEAVVTLSTEQGFPQLAAIGTIVRGWALAMQGQGEEGLAQIRQGITSCRATGAAVTVPFFCTMLAEVCDHLGYTEDGLQALAEAHTLVEQHDERWWKAEICRLQGDCRLRQPMPQEAEAEAWLQRALAVARRQEAKALELRAAMSLACLWQQEDKRAEAHALLAPIYGWFTEGFDTPDLQEAKTLLEELVGSY